MTACSEAGCDQPAGRRSGLCRKHYRRKHYRANRVTITAQRRAKYKTLIGEPRERHLARMRKYREEGRYPDDERPTNQLKREIGECQRCGYNAYLGALHWHHPDEDGGGKRRPDIRHIGWERARVFVSQCVLLCANCHAERHGGLW